MNCNKCGNKILGDVKYCSNCGNLINQDVSDNIGTNETNIPSNLEIISKQENKKIVDLIQTSKKPVSKVRLGIIVCIVLVFSVFFVSIFGGLKIDDYVTFDKDEIPTINYLYEDYKICSRSFSKNGNLGNNTVGYCDKALDNKTIDEYIDYLMEEEDFRIIDIKGYSRSVYKKSKDYGCYLIVSVKYEGTTIYYNKVLEEQINDDAVVA